MSSQIYYGRQFIKVSETLFIPIVFAGASNCTQTEYVGRRCMEIRERSFYVDKYFADGNIITTKEILEYNIDKYRQKTIDSNREYNEAHPEDKSWHEEYTDERFGYYIGCHFSGSRKATFSAFKSFYLNGCKTAVTVEQLVENDVPVVVSTYVYDEKKFTEQTGKEVLRNIYPKTTSELIFAIDKFTEYYKETGYGNNVNVYLEDDYKMDSVLRMRRKIFGSKSTSKKKELKEVDGHFTIHISGYGYMVKKTSRGFRYSPYETAGKTFLTEKLAQQYINRLKKGHFPYEITIEKVEGKHTIYA